MMNTTRRVVALTALIWLAHGVGAKGGLTYDIVDYPSISTPYTVSGTITTNGDTGTLLPSSDIVSWDITIFRGASIIASITTVNSAHRSQQFFRRYPTADSHGHGPTPSNHGTSPGRYASTHRYRLGKGQRPGKL